VRSAVEGLEVFTNGACEMMSGSAFHSEQFETVNMLTARRGRDHADYVIRREDGSEA